MDNISEKQYENLRNKFTGVVEEVLGEDYYNHAGDVYSCDTMTCEDIIYEFKQLKKERDAYRKLYVLFAILFMFSLIFIHLFIL